MKRLSPEVIDKIRRLKKDGLTNPAIAKELGLSTFTISKYTRHTEPEGQKLEGVELTEEEFASLPPETKAELNRLRAEREKLRLKLDIMKLQGQKEVGADLIADMILFSATLCSILTQKQETMINELTPAWKSLINAAEKINSPELLQHTVKSLWSSLGYNNSMEFLQDFISHPKWLEAYGLTRELLVRALETEKA